MERIASFTVDHTVLTPGLYLARQDGDAVTLDLRFKKPNTGDLLSNAEMHSVEHLIATLLRNAPERDAVLYFGPMGCQTGFYFLFDRRRLDLPGAIALLGSSPRRRNTRGRCPASPPGNVEIMVTLTLPWAVPPVPSIPSSSPTGRRPTSAIPPPPEPVFPRAPARRGAFSPPQRRIA